MLHGIRPGDNVVWQVECVDDYIPFIRPFRNHAAAHGRKLIYFRFAHHREFMAEDDVIRVCRLKPENGFEQFITDIHEVIRKNGRDAFYVFDSLSDLALDCFSERMIGNFFMLTCPYLFKLGTIGYFTVLRYYHSHHAAQPIEITTQLMLDVYRHRNRTYVQPLKVDGRYSPTMYMLHAWEGDDFTPVTDSATVSTVVTSGPWHGLQAASYRMVGMWDRRFIEAEDILKVHARGGCTKEPVDTLFRRQLRQIISRDERILALAEKHLTLQDLIHLWKRTIGSGLIGGKSVGMLLARAILRSAGGRWADVLEVHDSFFIGSDIFYSFLVQNGCWPIRQRQKNPATLFDGAEEGRQRILEGRFPDYIVRRFSNMLDYFGQCPIIVRSSSLLEDNFGNAFSGKYESVFCVNRGTHEERLESFLAAVRRVYAGTMSEEALAYRAKRGMLDRDEQMALLVQRVSGGMYGDFFYPHLAGVGFSYNAYAWEPGVDPDAGMLRLVFGLGTRAVERHDDDYTRLVALNAPAKRPEGDAEEIRHYTQRKVDYLDLKQNRHGSGYAMEVIPSSPGLPADWFSKPDDAGEGYGDSIAEPPRILTFDRVFAETAFIRDMREMLRVLSETYASHVDIEFTANFAADGSYRVNLLQCRPLQVRKGAAADAAPSVEPTDVMLKSTGGIVGTGRSMPVEWLLYVVPSVYGRLPESERYAVARLVGRIAHAPPVAERGNLVLLGPGRWGTRMASLGVPVSFPEINTASVICELAMMHERLTPDLSLGTHYFNDMVELDILYVGFMPAKEGSVFDEARLLACPNRLADIVAEAGAAASAIRLVRGDEAEAGRRLRFHADPVKQAAVLYIAPA